VKGGKANVVEPTKRTIRVQEEEGEASGDDGSLYKSQTPESDSYHLDPQTDFLKASAQAARVTFNAHSDIPGLEEAYAKFKRMYPKFQIAERVEELRFDKYNHLEQSRKVCLDYCGFGLFSYHQQLHEWESSSFGLSQISVNSLSSHALGADQGSIEKDLRKRIMEYLSIPTSEYTMVFTVSRGSAFKLLAESYPFHQNRRLVTVYDYESQSVNWMAEGAKNKGAKLRRACFKWPSMRLCCSELKRELRHKRIKRKDSAVGLFVFPVQSRVTGAKYSYQWMSMAQQNGWHVLLDAGALGPKDMDSLGISLFRPDFIITSFYKVFGRDPTGFGCLFIKNSVMNSLENQGGAPAVGLVRIVPPSPPSYLSDSADERDSKCAKDDVDGDNEEIVPKFRRGSDLPAFSGTFSSLQVRDVFESEMDSSFRDEVSEDIENGSIGEVMQSPICSEDENENLLCIDLGQSPLASEHFRGSPFRKVNPPKSTHKHLPPRSPKSPFYGQVNQDSSVISSDPPVSSVSPVLALSKSGSGRPNLVTEASGSPSNEAEANHTLQDQITDGKSHKFEHLDPGERQETPQMNVTSILRGSNGGFNLISEDEVGSSGRIDSWRFSKQSKLSLILENAEGERGDFTPRRGELPLTDVFQSTSGEITICNEDTKKLAPSAKEIISIANGSLVNGSAKIGNHSEVGNKLEHAMYVSPQVSKTKENAIRRETEGDFRLLGRREAGRILCLDDIDSIGSMSRRVSFSGEEYGGAHDQDEEGMSDAELAEEQEWTEREPRICCKHLDHVDSMGLNKSTLRLRYLINWLVTSLLQLRHHGPDGGVALVRIYGPKIRYDRGSALAFNLYNCKGVLVSPEIVQRLADKNNIALGLGFLSHLCLIENHAELQEALESDSNSLCKSIAIGRCEGKKVSVQVEVVTASLGFLSNFEDVYRMWEFVSKFLDAGYSESNECISQSGPSK